MRTLYLNNSGSRWIHVNDKHERFMPVFVVDTFHVYGKLRQAKYYSSLGNWGTIAVEYRGQVIERIPLDFEYYGDRIPVIVIQ